MRSSASLRLEQALTTLANEKRGLVALSNGHNSFLESNAVFVFGGFRAIGEAALVANVDGSATLIVTPDWDVERAIRQCSFHRIVGTSDVASAVIAEMKACGLDSKNAIFVGLESARRDVIFEIERGVGGTLAAQDDFARDLAKIRTAEELEYARKATGIAELGYERMLKSAKPGMREFELAADIYCEMKALGAEDNFLLMSASQHNLAVRAAGQRILEKGDIILAEITPCYRGQFVQICRTAVIGEPRPVVSEKFSVLQAAMRRGQEVALPGTRVSDVTHAMNQIIDSAGYGAYCRPPYMRVRGHGLGITSSRPGDIESDNHLKLESGMVFVMHPNQYIPESGYLLCGETVVIGDHGAESLSTRDAQLDVISV